MEEMIETWGAMSSLHKALSVIFITYIAHQFLKRIVIRQFEKLSAKTANDLDDRFIHFIDQFQWIVMCFIATLGVLKSFDVAIGPLLAGAGIFGVALGFAAKESMADVLAGIFLIADRPIRIGDRINFDAIGGGHWGGWGDVVDIGLRRTRIRNSDGVYVNYPNNLLSNSVITNFSYEAEPMRVRLRFQVDYDADIDQVREITLKVIAANPRIMVDSGKMIVRSLWDDKQGHLMSGVTLEARYRIEDVRKRTEIRAEILEELLRELKAKEVPMPKLSTSNALKN
jgi:small-conductance mechanosensitive channel